MRKVKAKNMTKKEILDLLNTPESELEIGVKYEGKTMFGLYEVKTSEGGWWKRVVYITTQHELDRLVNVCNQNPNTMNLLGFKRT